MTRQWLAVTDLLQASTAFMSAQTLHGQLHDQGHRIGLATVYRILQAMAEDGQVDVRRTESGEMSFRRCSSHHHHHLVCRSCGRAVEVTSYPIEVAVSHLAREGGFTALEHSVEITGLCRDCAPDTPELGSLEPRTGEPAVEPSRPGETR